jgi:hypothetical protein
MSLVGRSSKRLYGQLDPSSRRVYGGGDRMLARCSYAVNVLLMMYFFHLSNQRVNRLQCVRNPLPNNTLHRLHLASIPNV